MEHLGTKYMETERLILRRFVQEDAQAMFDNWASDEEVTKYLVWPPHSGVEISRLVLKDWIKLYGEECFYQWAIVPKDLGQPIGSISVVRMDDAIGSVHIGYCLGKAWWHKGYMSEALGRLIDFFFEEVGANRVEARHDPRNPHSGGVMRKCGMKLEGTLRQAGWNNQGICDESWYGILKADWLASRKM